MKVLLCIPPDYDWNFPPLGTPALAGYLRKNLKAQVFQKDYNIRHREYLWRKISHSGGGNDQPASMKNRVIRMLMKQCFDNIGADKYYFDYLPRKENYPFATLAYDNNTNSSFFFTERLLSSEILRRYVTDEKENTYLDFFRREAIPDEIAEDKIDLLGISITSPSQVIPSLTLASLVRERRPDIHITAGGQWVSLYRDVIIRHPFFGEYFDTFVYFEGETPLASLIESLDGKGRIEDVPNLIYAKGSRLRKSVPVSEEDMDRLPCPDFDGLPLADYGAHGEHGGPALTFETSRGCYWGKCAYCVDLPLPKLSYRRKKPAVVVDDMDELVSKYGARHLMFSDPALSPRQMREMSRLMIERKVKVKWWTMARLDRGFSGETFSLAKKAGCVGVNFGFESINDRVCRVSHKGNTRAVSARVIRECSGVGIEVNLQTMLGMPAETYEEALDTIQYLVEMKDRVGAVFNEYYLTPGNRVYEDPGRYGIEFKKDDSLPFKFFHEFKRTDGLTEEQVGGLILLYNCLRTKNANPPAKLPASLVLNDGFRIFKTRLELIGAEAALGYLSSSAAADLFLPLDDLKNKILSILRKGPADSKRIIARFSKKYDEETLIAELGLLVALGVIKSCRSKKKT